MTLHDMTTNVIVIFFTLTLNSLFFLSYVLPIYVQYLKQTDKNGLINWQIPTSSLEKEWLCRFTVNMSYIVIWYDLHQDCRSPSNLQSDFQVLKQICLDFVCCIHECFFLVLISRYRYTWLAVLCTLHTNVIFFSCIWTCFILSDGLYHFSTVTMAIWKVKMVFWIGPEVEPQRSYTVLVNLLSPATPVWNSGGLTEVVVNSHSTTVCTVLKVPSNWMQNTLSPSWIQIWPLYCLCSVYSSHTAIVTTVQMYPAVAGNEKKNWWCWSKKPPTVLQWCCRHAEAHKKQWMQVLTQYMLLSCVAPKHEFFAQAETFSVWAGVSLPHITLPWANLGLFMLIHNLHTQSEQILVVLLAYCSYKSRPFPSKSFSHHSRKSTGLKDK